MAFPKGANTPEQLGVYYNWNISTERNPTEVPSGTFVRPLHAWAPTAFSSINNRRIGGEYRSGGGFVSAWTEIKHFPSDSVRIWRPGFGLAYSGQFIVNPSLEGLVPTPSISAASVNADVVALMNRGAEAWNRMRPDNPDFTLGQEFMELKDLPGTLKQAVKELHRLVKEKSFRRTKKGSTLSKAGQYHLAINFGWLPLLRSVRNFAEAHAAFEKRFAQLIRDAERPVRRSTLRKDGSSTMSGAESGRASESSYQSEDIYYTFVTNPTFVTQCYNSNIPARTTRSTKMIEKTWAEGRFRYILPPGPRTGAWKKKMWRRIMGWRVTPAEVYELMPWSWLMDYFTDLGQFMKAISPGVADRLICDYAYLMRHSEFTVRIEAEQGFTNRDGSGYRSVVVRPSMEKKSTRKIRVKASPFGFGIKQQDLSLTQVAILGALGASKLP